MLLTLGLCQSVPYLLSRPDVYEIAIAGGYFCISAAIYFLTRGFESRGSSYWLAAFGLMFDLAVSCRPHLGLAGVIALSGLAVFLTGSRTFKSAFSRKNLNLPFLERNDPICGCVWS